MAPVELEGTGADSARASGFVIVPPPSPRREWGTRSTWAPTRQFVNGTQYIDERVVMRDIAGGGQDHYYLLEELYSVAGLAGAVGQLEEMYVYDTYGRATVWAWRKRRIYKIKKAVNCVLCLFPFETAIYQEYQVGHAFVGHPLADAIPLYSSKNTAREELGLPQDKQIVAILPGSRQQELKYLARTYYSNTVRIQFFGVAGFCYLIFSIVFLVLAGYLQLALEYTNASIIPMLIAGLLVEASLEFTFFILSELHNFQCYKSCLDRLMGYGNSHFLLYMFFVFS